MSEYRPLAKILDGMERWVREMPDRAPSRLWEPPGPIPPPVLSREEALGRAGVPAALREVAFEEPDPWPADPGAGVALPDWRGAPWALYLHGGVGSGKTMLAVELLARGLARCRSGLFVRAAAIPRALYGADGEESFAALAGARWLVVDDLGRGTMGRGWEAVGEVVAERHAEGLPTIFTANLPLDAIAEHGDAHLADRLMEGLVVEVAGGSRRGRA